MPYPEQLRGFYCGHRAYLVFLQTWTSWAAGLEVWSCISLSRWENWWGEQPPFLRVVRWSAARTGSTRKGHLLESRERLRIAALLRGRLPQPQVSSLPTPSAPLPDVPPYFTLSSRWRASGLPWTYPCVSPFLTCALPCHPCIFPCLSVMLPTP